MMAKKNGIMKVLFTWAVCISHKNKEKRINIITLFPIVNVYCLEQNETREETSWDPSKKINECQIYLKTEANTETKEV